MIHFFLMNTARCLKYPIGTSKTTQDYFYPVYIYKGEIIRIILQTVQVLPQSQFIHDVINIYFYLYQPCPVYGYIVNFHFQITTLLSQISIDLKTIVKLIKTHEIIVCTRNKEGHIQAYKNQQGNHILSELYIISSKRPSDRL